MSDAIKRLEQYEYTAAIQKLSEKSGVRDCKRLMQFLEKSGLEPPMLVRTIAPIWRCKLGIGGEWCYGYTLDEAIESAFMNEET
jgi:hypothetical protein